METYQFKSFRTPMNVLIQGASRGIGGGFASALLASPSVDRLILTSRAPEDSAHLDALRRRSRERLLVLPMDVTREDTIAAAARRVGDEAGELHLIVNCAGVLHDGAGMQPERRLAEIDPVNLQKSFAVNACGPLLVAKHFAPLLPRRERAIFASISARVGSIGDNRLGGWYAYRGAKAAQNMFTRCLSVEIPRRARQALVVALHPGTVDTDLSRPFQERVPDEKLFDIPRAVQQLLSVLDGLGPDDNGGFFAWDGQRIPW